MMCLHKAMLQSLFWHGTALGEGMSAYLPNHVTCLASLRDRAMHPYVARVPLSAS